MTSPVTVDAATGTVIFAVVSVLAVLAMVAVYLDASRRNVAHPLLLSVSIGFLFVFYALPGVAACIVYLLLREDLPTKSPPAAVDGNGS